MIGQIFKRKRGREALAFLCGMCMLLAAGGLFLPMQAQAASQPSYKIRVNRKANCVTVYTVGEEGEYTEPVKAMACSTGGKNTPLGSFRIPVKYRWRALVGNTWGQYATRINGPILFHSVPYDRMDPSTMQKGEYNYLGETRSHGCVRLTAEDAKWIYDNCPVGTAVEIYDGEDPGPLGKPETAKIGEGDTWDPTDVWSDGNPFLAAHPEIRVQGGMLHVTAEEWTAGEGSIFLEGVTAVSSTGEDITGLVEVEMEPGGGEPGVYRITYVVTDLVGKRAERSRFVRVKED